MGRKHIQGLGGVEKDCAKAVLYYKDVAHHVATKSTEINKYVEKIYLQKEIFNMNFNAFADFKFQKATLDETLLFESLKINAPKKFMNHDLFRYLNGKYDSTFDVEGFLTQAFTLPKEELKSVASIVGYILYRGIRVDKNFKKAYEMFKMAAGNREPKGLNGLGLMYLNGDHVIKDALKAYYLFEKAANLGDSDAQFNLGSLMIYSENNDIPRDVDTGFKYITLSGQQGHLGALYAHAIAYMEGSDFYSTCDTSARLFGAVVERGEWNIFLKEALELYNKKYLHHATVQYLVSAYLGYEPGIINAAILAEKYSVFDEETDIAVGNVYRNEKILREDEMLLALHRKKFVDLRWKG